MLSMSGDVRIDRNFWTFIVIWVLCTLVSVMVHEMGHVIMARIFGQPGSITLAGMGGQAIGNYAELSPQKRILVALAGPFAGFTFLGLVVLLDNQHWNLMMDWINLPALKTSWCYMEQHVAIRFSPVYFLASRFLILMNLIWNLFNLLPIIPMDGGMVLSDVSTIVSPRKGVIFAHGVSFVLATLLTMFYLVELLQKYKIITLPITLYGFIFPEFAVFSFGSMAFQNFMALRQHLSMHRHQDYAQRDD